LKRQIKKIALLIVAILGVNCVNAQTDFSIHLGMLFPQGDFAESRMDNGQVAWGDKTNRGGAGLGFDAGMKFRFNIPSVKGLGIIASADFFLNMPNDDVKDWKEDLISELEKEEYLDEFSIAIPHYINVPIMVGLNYEYGINDNIKIWGEGALGLNIGTLTSFKQSFIGTAEEYDYYYGHWYDVDVEETVKYSYSINTSLAFQFGAGFMLNDKYSLGVHYYSLGSQKIKGEAMLEEIYDGESSIEDERFTFKRINPGMLTIRFGLHF
jgi:hypothetical protein